jgi:hypothetical protein
MSYNPILGAMPQYISHQEKSNFQLKYLAPQDSGQLKLYRMLLLGFWTLSINWYSIEYYRTKCFITDLFPSSGEVARDTYSVWSVRKNDWGYVFPMDPTEKVSPTPSPEDGNRPSFHNVVFLKHQTMDKFQKTHYPKCQTP